MVPKDDAYNTVEFEDYYVIKSSFRNFERRFNGGKLVTDKKIKPIPEKTFIIELIENVLSDEERATLVDALKAICNKVCWKLFSRLKIYEYLDRRGFINWRNAEETRRYIFNSEPISCV